MKRTCWVAALVLCCGSVPADAGHLGCFKKKSRCHQSCAPSCAAPAECCTTEPSCGAPAECAASTPNCCAPVECHDVAPATTESVPQTEAVPMTEAAPAPPESAPAPPEASSVEEAPAYEAPAEEAPAPPTEEPAVPAEEPAAPAAEPAPAADAEAFFPTRRTPSASRSTMGMKRLGMANRIDAAK